MWFGFVSGKLKACMTGAGCCCSKYERQNNTVGSNLGLQKINLPFRVVFVLLLMSSAGGKVVGIGLDRLGLVISLSGGGNIKCNSQ